ncbi:TetR/AcrR family transcriptional regulator [Williamsia sterculiae]|uniref:Transcriptional regulator, TetR family n=1 Tax=Williamsia sterculiae TaxID=1344003 RepID=A0A1N7DPT4_9NOCA|nr:helix-turn-helix domain-containing protein [Williamsia sterculiae]SIR77758.1 transcriptional regulator, TetR family [Williamsia sterculiae]
MRQGETRKRTRRADVREAILASARVVFAERGYDGASLDRVAQQAGFTKGAVYSNFSTKDELFQALIEAEIADRVTSVTAELAKGDDDPSIHKDDFPRMVGDRLSAAVRADPHWQLLFLEFWIRTVRQPDNGSGFIEFRRRLRRRVEDAVSEFWPEELRAGVSVSDLALAALALSNGLAIEHMVDPDAVSDGLLGRLLANIVRQPA